MSPGLATITQWFNTACMLCAIDVCWVASDRTDTEFSVNEVDGGLAAELAGWTHMPKLVANGSLMYELKCVVKMPSETCTAMREVMRKEST